MIRFIEDHRADHGVEPICRILPIAPATFYDHLAKRADPSRLSDRAVRDAQLKPEIERVFEDNLSVYGVRKVWHQMRREGFDIARCTIARLMKDIGIEGVIRGKKPKTTIPDKALPCPLDRVNRQFHAPAPNLLWVSDFTYRAPRPGWSGVHMTGMHGERRNGRLPCPLLQGGMSPSGGDLPSTGRVT
jgi:putative transposase